MRIRWLLAPSLSLLLSTGALAQVPDGWFVAANFKNTTYDPFWNPNPPPGDGGLFLVHPTVPGAAIPVTNLPPAITGAGVPSPRGACTVVYRPSDGALIVGDEGPAGTTISLHVVNLTGSAATGITTIPLGTSAPGSVPAAWVGQAALLPNGDVVVAVAGLGPPGPLAGEILGIVSTASGTVTTLPLTPVPPGKKKALAGDARNPNAPIAYFGMFQSPTLTQSTIYSVPLPGGGGPTTVITFGPTPVIGLTNLALDCSNQLRMTAFIGPPNLFTIDPVGPTSSPLLSPPLGNLNAVAVEKVTGDLALATWQPSPYPWSVLRRTSAGAVTLLASAPPGGWGAPSGLTVNPNPEAYGPATLGAYAYSWEICPNAGGLPTVGNAGFSLTVSSTGSTSGFVAASLASASLPNFLGLRFTLLLDPAQIVLPPVPHGGTIPLPIPNIPTLVGARLFFQSFHLDVGVSAGIAATEGVEVTVL